MDVLANLPAFIFSRNDDCAIIPGIGGSYAGPSIGA